MLLPLHSMKVLVYTGPYARHLPHPSVCPICPLSFLHPCDSKVLHIF